MENTGKHKKQKLIEKQLIKESKIVADDSMNVLKEFEKLLVPHTNN